jgi:hypothetical protein
MRTFLTHFVASMSDILADSRKKRHFLRDTPEETAREKASPYYVAQLGNGRPANLYHFALVDGHLCAVKVPPSKALISSKSTRERITGPDTGARGVAPYYLAEIRHDLSQTTHSGHFHDKLPGPKVETERQAPVRRRNDVLSQVPFHWAWYAQQATTRDRTHRQALLHQIQQKLYDEARVLPIWELGILHASGPRVAGSGLGLIPLFLFSGPLEEVQLKS